MHRINKYIFYLMNPKLFFKYHTLIFIIQNDQRYIIAFNIAITIN